MRLYSAFATVGGLSMVSRVLGFLRDILIAAVLGTGMIADAFVVAFRMPNLFRRLFAEGAFNAAFVPLFAKRLEADGNGSAHAFAEEALAGLFAVLLLVTAIAQIAMPWLVLGLAPGFATEPEKLDLATALTRIAFPYLMCMSLVALLSGLLNSLHRYMAAAAAPIVLNAVLVAVMLIAHWRGYHNDPAAGYLLVWGVFAAGILQLAMLWIAAKRAGFALRLRLPRMTEGVRRLLALGIPGLIAGGITQINIVVGTIIASLEASAVSYLYYADRLYQLPLGIVGVAIGVVLLPDLSRHLGAGNHTAAMDSQNRSMELALLLTLPAAVALLVAAEPIIRVLFERGAFTHDDTQATAWALAAFAIGLPAFVLIKVLQPGFFAHEDTKTPMRYAGVNLVLNAAGSIILFFGFKTAGFMPHVGIALATSIAAWVNAVMLWGTLKHRGHFIIDNRLARNVPLIALASVLMGAGVIVAGIVLDPWMRTGAGLMVQASGLAALVTFGVVLFATVILATGVMTPAQLKRKVRR
ncbi:MAG: murein biosynthesis integral membrane protein MurJ [Hyphomicrobium sp.]|nr:murein biosynthesis integral membrane protein MurJ [Hyphomicrobium sp.]MBN9278774.1 murein biosynthesis integral membrane protein MurJ [Hyphomicrobium sp.]